MPKAGTVTVSIRPVDAGAVARWLQSLPASLWGVRLSNVRLLPNGVRAGMFDKFQSFAKRQRKGGGFANATMELLREDAVWLAAKSQRGMFGASSQKHLPAQVFTVCRECKAALAKRAGRPKYRSLGLDAAMARQKRNISDSCHPVDPRWMKRLRQRKKNDEAMAHRLTAADGLWGGSLSPDCP